MILRMCPKTLNVVPRMVPLSLLLLSLLLLPPSHALNGKGLIQLDSATFNKVVPKFRVVFLKFDMAYPYGDEHNAFVDLAGLTQHLPDVLIGEIPVKDYGDRDNADMAEEFSVKTDEFPAPFLFLNGDVKNGRRYRGTINLESLKKFLKSEANVYIPLQSCVPEFDQLAEDYVLATEDLQREEAFKKALLKQAETTVVWEKRSADVYLVYFNKLREKGGAVEEGKDFLKNEKKRLQKLLKEKVSDKKKEELNMKFNILLSFLTPLELKEMEQEVKQNEDKQEL